MIKDFLARIGCLTIVAAVVVGAWYFRDDITRALGRVDVLAPSTAPSEDLAIRAERKLNELSDTDEGAVRFTEAELQSLLTYRIAPHLVRGVEDPIIELRDTVIILSALVRPDELDEFAPPEVLQQFLSDTARVAVTLIPGLRRPGTGEATVTSLQAGALIVPAMMVPFVLQNLDVPGMDVSGSDVLIPLPAAVTGLEFDREAITVRIGRAERTE